MKTKEKTPLNSGNKIQFLLVIGFLALLALPWPLWLLLQNHCDTTNYENRVLAGFPTKETAVSQWPAQFESWLGDKAPFRNNWLQLKAGMDRRMGTVDSSNVLLGKEGWLFLKDVSDSKSISDYQGLTSYTPEQMAEYQQLLTTLSKSLENKGSSLAVLIAPAKEGVYSCYMPDSIPVVSRPTRVQALVQSLQTETDLTVVFPQQELMDAAQSCQVYYKYDTHWNDIGGWLAAQNTLKALGRPFADNLPERTVQPGWACPTDLANMSGNWARCTDDVYYEADVPRAQETAREYGGELNRYQGQGSSSLLLVRDSFGSMLAPHLAESFDKTLVLHGNILNTETLSAEQPQLPDVVVLEVGERFCDTMLSRAQTLLAWAEAAAE